MTLTPFVLNEPVTRTTSVVFASPHSGKADLALFGGQVVLDHKTIRSSEDAHVDRLFSKVIDYGAPFLVAQVPRAYVDLNRAADELDPALIEGVRRNVHNPRVGSGLGVIPRVVAGGRSIYRGKLTLEEAHSRLQTYWYPYHDKLTALLDQSFRLFGESILIDCHSMPREALDAGRKSGERPHVVIGDRFGAAASARLVDQIAAAFEGQGLQVAHNAPFAGAYSTVAYGRPVRSQHAVQVEIDRSLYMNEATLEILPEFDELQSKLLGAASEIAALGSRKLPLAAE
ncbi:N-formylglutamate amidohydrolase [Marivivens sp. JLT3646]|uniref:N-formylglutamate amidohydrolase n=1 Tax=Marivivens sp. JLT3646 TaxID=1920883 RepID=UPI0008014F44|nr:N-formylglutamate amidohydrolase [Marivivens sp. JLT3646]APO88397.1 N-formylglutamate amidohydrolase [Marivivens sp. JLT3646]OBR38662.1 N-formylglutamate amidohydrolase [Donghicola sp. JL3646]